MDLGIVAENGAVLGIVEDFIGLDDELGAMARAWSMGMRRSHGEAF